MTSRPSDNSDSVELIAANDIRYVYAGNYAIGSADAVDMNEQWFRAVERSPNLFDGSVIACVGSMVRPPGCLLIAWVRTSYRVHALRRVPRSTGWLSSIFVAVIQPTDGGSIVIGRMSSTTATPGRWQLPGGSVEPPNDDWMSNTFLTKQAARELHEETGLDCDSGSLELWQVSRGEFGNIGLIYLAPRKSEEYIRERFGGRSADLIGRGFVPEFDEIRFVGDVNEIQQLADPCVDYLVPVLLRFKEEFVSQR